jgi:hypothetical protein
MQGYCNKKFPGMNAKCERAVNSQADPKSCQVHLLVDSKEKAEEILNICGRRSWEKPEQCRVGFRVKVSCERAEIEEFLKKE